MSIIRLAFLFILLVAGRIAAGGADSLEDGDAEPPAAATAAAEPGPKPGLRRLLPLRLQIGPQIGMLGARLQSSREYRALLEPTEAREGAWKSLSWGAVLTARWNHGFSLTLAPRREAYGVETREQTVAFPDNPFPHTLAAKTRLDYMVWPVQAGMGWQGARQRFEVALGVYKASLVSADIRWIVDGEEYPNRPAVGAVGNHYGWLVSTGYGFRLGGGELLAGVEAQQGFESVLRGLEGEVRPRSWRALAAYLWTLPLR